MMDDAAVRGTALLGSKGTYKSLFCLQCDLPILVFGRILPCAHVFCLHCAHAMQTCRTCHEPRTDLQAIPANATVYFSIDARVFPTKEALSFHYREMLLRNRLQVTNKKTLTPTPTPTPTPAPADEAAEMHNLYDGEHEAELRRRLQLRLEQEEEARRRLQLEEQMRLEREEQQQREEEEMQRRLDEQQRLHVLHLQQLQAEEQQRQRHQQQLLNLQQLHRRHSQSYDAPVPISNTRVPVSMLIETQDVTPPSTPPPPTREVGMDATDAHSIWDPAYKPPLSPPPVDITAQPMYGNPVPFYGDLPSGDDAMYAPSYDPANSGQ